ncbi:MAG TPA: hypothetical protein PK054_05665 [Anaerohalosphaeraceae bacterium]|nr:hypothetical protein [Anaerohalosphaeraceae bacterium]HPP56054.1 hypothetical protein [Anaerohalosphaeraceae bacterium]
MAAKIKKLLVVAFLSATIWIWAFMSLEKETTLLGTVELSPTADPDYFVTFAGGQSRATVKITFRGSPAKIAELERRHRAPDADPFRERLDFYYDPKELGHDKEGTYQLSLEELIRKGVRVRALALAVMSCEPASLEVQVQRLVLREVPAEVRDEAGQVLTPESIEPARVAMYVREGTDATARVVLSANQIEDARLRPVRERPFINLGPGEKKQYASQTVLIRMPSTLPLEAQVFQTNPGRIGFVMPAELVGAYKVEVLDDLTTIHFRSTPEAKTQYQQQPYHLLIQVLSGDQQMEQTPPRPVIYNFPQDLVRRGMIQAPDPPAMVRIRLIPVTPSPAPATAP